MIRRPRKPTKLADEQAERARVERQRAINVRLGRPKAPVPPAEPLFSIDRELESLAGKAPKPPREILPKRKYRLSRRGKKSLQEAIHKRHAPPVRCDAAEVKKLLKRLKALFRKRKA